MNFEIKRMEAPTTSILTLPSNAWQRIIPKLDPAGVYNLSQIEELESFYKARHTPGYMRTVYQIRKSNSNLISTIEAQILVTLGIQEEEIEDENYWQLWLCASLAVYLSEHDKNKDILMKFTLGKDGKLKCETSKNGIVLRFEQGSRMKPGDAYKKIAGMLEKGEIWRRGSNI